MICRLAVTIGLVSTVAVGGAAVAKGDARPSATTVSSLHVFPTTTPHFPVPRFETAGTYPQVTDGHLSLDAVNAALRAAVLADQRSYAPYARKEKPQIAYTDYGVYRTGIDRNLLSASTVVVSALMPLTRELFPGQHGGDGWLGITVRVPSGIRVTITDLLAHPSDGLRHLATLYIDRLLRQSGGRECLRLYPGDYSPTVANYRAFALTPRGLAIGTREDTACYRTTATVPYRLLRPYLSKLGIRLVAGVRTPR